MNEKVTLHRDGTSQAERLLAALDPDYVAVDERSVKDLLAFARAYAKELTYFGVKDDTLQALGDWRAFLSEDLDLDEIVAFIQDPSKFSEQQASAYTRPHLVLFLTFLKLLSHAQTQLNNLTRRHLDFYYQQVLGITKRPGIPDQVNVLLELASTSEQFLLPAGSHLNAGTDSEGQDLVYSTDQDIVVNQTQVAKLSSIFAEKRIMGIREARELHTGPQEEAFVRMLQVALGNPAPGDSLPPYPTGEAVDYPYLLALQRLIDFVGSGLFMAMPQLRSLMRLKQQRDDAAAEWQEINQLLEKAAQKRSNNPNFKLSGDDSHDPRDFETNLNRAMGGPPNFDGLTEVENIYDLYAQRIRESGQQFIRDELYFEDNNDFVRMMQLKVRIDNEWQEINRILQQAGQEKQKLDPPYTPHAGADPTDFTTNLEAAVGPLTYPRLTGLEPIKNLETYYSAFLTLESYFFMSAENFAYLMAVAVAEDPSATPPEWNKVYDILAEVYKLKVYAARRAQLQQIRAGQGFEAMLEAAVARNQSQAGLSSLELLKESLTNEADRAFLDEIDQKVQNDKHVTSSEWEQTYRLVELAQRVQLAEPMAQKEEWLNLYPREDATSVLSSLGLEADADNPRWKTFGQGQALVEAGSPPPVEFGWAISSPLLALSQGQRHITLTLGFQSDQFVAAEINALFPTSEWEEQKELPFRIEISTEKEWLEVNPLEIIVGEYQALSGVPIAEDDKQETIPALQFKLTFAENIAALTALPEGEVLAGDWPVLRLMLRQIWQPDDTQPSKGRYITHYQPFQSLVLLKTHLQVEVFGLTPWHIQNDSSTLKPNSPFEPFGRQAVAGGRFYLGHPELIYKRLDSLDFHFEWLGGPTNLETHYHNYPAMFNTVTTGNTSSSSFKNFTVRVSLIDERIDLVLASEAPLFSQANASLPQTISFADLAAAIKSTRPGYLYRRLTEAQLDNDLLAWNRYLQWELNDPDFQHDVYPTLASQKSIELSTAIANNTANQEIKATLYQLNPPYSPKIKDLSLNYKTSIEIVMADYQAETQIDKIFHVQPFGYNQVQPEAEVSAYLFLPQYRAEGQLYIGLEAVQAPQNLSLLFQMAEGSADPDLEPIPIEWSYLSGNRWLSLDSGQTLQDTTRGLINSGIISFALEAALPNTLLAADLYWLRATIAQNSNSLCDTVAIHTQAVSATFINQNNAPDHLTRPLPAQSITKLAQARPQIKAISQPYTSYGGKMAEQEQTFYTRLSERLRHKNRTLTLWDYEHLILEQFPQIYKAKCLPANINKAGQVDIIVIPDIRNKLPFNPFEPKAPSDLIANIESYLAARMPAFASLKVKNAHYVQLKARFGVRFLAGYGQGYYNQDYLKQQLNEAITRFLSPWAYEDGADIVIGGRVYANVLINFIEEQAYIDYVAGIKLFRSDDNGRTFHLVTASTTDGYWVEANKPTDVLVAARQHEIDIISETGYEEEDFSGINYMKVELDFMIA